MLLRTRNLVIDYVSGRTASAMLRLFFNFKRRLNV